MQPLTITANTDNRPARSTAAVRVAGSHRWHARGHEDAHPQGMCVQVANFMEATVLVCNGKAVPKDAVGRRRARAAAAAALVQPGAVPLSCYDHRIAGNVCR